MENLLNRMVTNYRKINLNEEKKMKKSVIAVLTATIIMLSSMTPMLMIQPTRAQNTDPASWYMTVPGVLNSDTYSLYPFSSTPLTIGFSQFGELVNPNGIGLMYGTNTNESLNIDPFAADPYVPMFEWNQGWLINITYAYGGYYRNVWAFALYSDSFNDSSIGGNWKMATSPDSTSVLGGRKYGGVAYDASSGNLLPIGYAMTAPLTVLYNGPRSFVALSQTTIGEDATTPLVGVYITIVFDKVNKYVMLYKDVKLLDTRKFTSDLQVEFSNRGEWDLGLTTRPASWAHWFTGQSTSYSTGYQPFYPSTGFAVAQVISQSTPGYVGYAAYWPDPVSLWMEATYLTDRTTMLSSLETKMADFTGTGTTTVFALPNGTNHPVSYPRGMGTWADDPLVFVNGKLVAESLTDPTGWHWSSSPSYQVIFNTAPASGAHIWIEYKQNVYKTDMSDSPKTPYIIGEWDFNLGWENTTFSTNQFRAVTCYGVTDYHDANNGNVGETSIYPVQLDREVKYQLNQVFNPFDLNSAVNKKTDRYVEFSTNPIDSTTFTTNSLNIPVWVVPTSGWDQYDNFTERVIDLNTNTVLNRYNGDYTFTANPDGTATFHGLTSTHYYKFLYSTYTNYANGGPITAQLVSGQKVNATLHQNYTFNSTVIKYWTDPTGVSHALGSEGYVTFSITNKTTSGNWTSDMWFNYSTPEVEWDQAPFKVFKEDTTWLESGASFASQNVTVGVGTTLQFDFPSQVEFGWGIRGPQGPLFTNLQDVHFTQFCADWAVNISVFYNVTENTYTVFANVTFAPGESDTLGNVYVYKLPGRYEWVTVGREASTIDSAGAVDVAAAFKDKQVEIGNTAMDMMGLTNQTEIPYLLSKTTSGKTPDFQNYWITPDSTSPGQRLNLADDWCTRYPVSSSNIIAEGGPLANQVTEYFNSFTTAFYAEPWFTPYTPWKGAIVSLSCWSKNVYTNSGGENGTGYATIGTFLDLNGTVGLVIYGLDARDTYYASQFFYGDIIQELQTFPSGATSIILKISYADPKHPTFTIVEVLGTISETLVLGSTNMYLTSALKGGIHPDP